MSAPQSQSAGKDSDGGAASSPPATYSVLVADDNAAYRMALAAVLIRDRTLHIVGEVGDGEAAVEMVGRSAPDIVLMDIIMPRLDGLEAARRIITRHHIPVLLLSALARYPEQRPDLRDLTQGMPRGQGRAQTLPTLPTFVDLIDKPILVGPGSQASIQALIARIKSVVKKPGPVRMGKGPVVRYDAKDTLAAPSSATVVAIAASTGGLGALRSILGRLPSSFPPMVIAQHIDPVLGQQFAPLLHEALGRPVVTVENLAELQESRLYVALPGRHLLVRPGQVVARPAAGSELAPSADQLFSSVAATYGARAVGVVLTGMGRDGAAGLRKLRDTGGWTIGQDPASSVVDGMPRAALEKGACCEVLTLPQLGDRLAQLSPRPEVPR